MVLNSKKLSALQLINIQIISELNKARNIYPNMCYFYMKRERKKNTKKERNKFFLNLFIVQFTAGCFKHTTLYTTPLFILQRAIRTSINCYLYEYVIMIHKQRERAKREEIFKIEKNEKVSGVDVCVFIQLFFSF